MSEKKFENKVALVSGASRGIGREVALGLAKEGAHVIALARTTGALEALDDDIQNIGGKATLIPADIRAFDKIDSLGPLLADKFGKLDIFIGNAGALGELTPLPHMDAKKFAAVMQVNYEANFRFIRTLDPLLRASPAGRMVFTSSSLAQKPLAFWGPYCASKAAMEMMVRCYAEEVSETALRVNLVDPGIVDTAMLSEAFPGGYQGDGLRQPEELVPLYLSLCEEGCKLHGQVQTITA